MFFHFGQHKYMYLIQKESMDPSFFEVWNKNIASFVAKTFFSNSGRWSFLAILVSNIKMSKLN